MRSGWSAATTTSRTCSGAPGRKILALRHSRVEVPGVGHEAERMFNSACGRAALFDAAGCDMKPGEAMMAPK